MGTFEAVEGVISEALRTTAPAITLAVYLRGQQVINQAYGFVDPERQSMPTQTNTLFDLASVTKLFTTTAFLMQVADGKVSIDTRVVDVLPEFGQHGARPIGPQQDPHTLAIIPPPADFVDPGPVDPASVTFRHLLTHTSGLPPWRSLFLRVGQTPPPPGQPDPISHSERLTKALELIADTPFVDQPGREVRYSDLGLILIGAAVARLDGAESLAAVISERVLRPNGLESVMFNPDINTHISAPTELDMRWRGRRCLGEVHDENACSLGGIAGHAGLFGTADNVARFGVSWLDALAGNERLSQAVAQEAVREHAVTGVERRGLGWARRTPGVSSSGQYFSENSFGHTGFTGTSLWVDPQRQLVVALMTNRVYHGRDAENIIKFRKALHDAVVLYVDSL